MSKFLTVLFGIFIFFDLQCYEWDPEALVGKCPYGCGQRYRDVNIQKIQKSTAQLIKDIGFNNPMCFCNYSMMEDMGSMRFHNNDFFHINCEIEIDSDYDIGSYDPFTYEVWISPYDVEYFRYDPAGINTSYFDNIKEFALENYCHFLRLVSFLEEDISKRFEIFTSHANRKINEYNEAIYKARQDKDFYSEYWEELNKDSYPYYSTYFPYRNLEKEIIERINKERVNFKNAEKNYQEESKVLNQYRTEIDNVFQSIYDWCAENHQLPLSFYHLGFHKFHLGNYVGALDDIKRFMMLEPNFTAKDKLLQGEIEAEVGLYQEAIQSLSEVVKLDPGNKEAYFERAACYFELGDFDQSLSDYLASGIKPTQIPSDSMEMIAFSLGLTKGIIKGGAQGGLEFIPSILASLHGLGHGLWVFAKDPVGVSVELVQATQACMEFIKNNTPKESLKKLVPELKDLLENWDEHKDIKRGEIIGYVIGKYGVDIFACAGIAKGVKAYRELKKANNLLTYEAMALSRRNKKLIKVEAIQRARTRKQMLKYGNLKIKFDTQGKHIVGHRNYLEGRSIIEHSDLQGLVNKYAGTGIRAKRAKNLPGQHGYQEIVNFEEFIGYDIDFETGKKTATTWGKIHYATDGVHVVPVKP